MITKDEKQACSVPKRLIVSQLKQSANKEEKPCPRQQLRTPHSYFFAVVLFFFFNFFVIFRIIPTVVKNSGVSNVEEQICIERKTPEGKSTQQFITVLCWRRGLTFKFFIRATVVLSSLMFDYNVLNFDERIAEEIVLHLIQYKTLDYVFVLL